MSNRQTLPQSISPVNGDVQSTVGSPTVVVTGIQQVPVLSQQPLAGQILIYDDPTKQYIPGDPIVSGTDAPGNPSSRNPVQVAGIDNGGLVRELQTDTSGSLYLAGVEQRLDILIQEIRALKTAIIALDNTLVPQDFDGPSYTDLATSETVLP